jgi:ATP-dependent Lhr-like helicase
LQETDDGLGRNTWKEWLGEPPALGVEVFERADALVSHLLDEGWLFADGGLIGIGDEAQAKYGRRNFLELMSAFVADPMYSVRHGRNEIGLIPDEGLIAAFQNKNGPPILLLAGRSWRVLDVDWKRRKVSVEPYDRPGKIRYPGVGQPLSFALCQSMAAVAGGEGLPVQLTQRAVDELVELRLETPSVGLDKTTLEFRADGSVRWWTFAGLRANIEIAARLAPIRDQVTQRSNLFIDLEPRAKIEDLETLLNREAPLSELLELADWATAGLKLAHVLPDEWAEEVALRRLADPEAVEAVLSKPMLRAHSL